MRQTQNLDGRKGRRGNEGSAFVISILVLFVLSVLGLALMLTTSTEKEIAINYRWGEQAFFNADAALEYGKNVLASYAVVSSDFSAILPPARGFVQVNDASEDRLVSHPEGGNNPCDPAADGCRDYQYHVDQCPPGVPGTLTGPCNRIYIGRVLVRQDGTQVMYDYRAPAGVVGDLDNDGVADIDGTATVWVRRPLVGDHDYGFLPDDEPHDRVILTAEGTAPGGGGPGAGRPVSVRRLEMSIRLPTDGIEGERYSDVSKRNDDTQSKSTYGNTQNVN